MKKLLFVLSLILSLSMFQNTFAAPPAPAPGITLEVALSIAQKEFEGQDVDYYLVEDGSEDIWSILVDTNPMIYWEHDYWIIAVSKKMLATVDVSKPLYKSLSSSMPDEDLTPLDVKNRNQSELQEPFLIGNISPTKERAQTGKRIYALIINGGINKNSNRPFFWEDCSNIYRVLTQVYSVPKSNIFPIMADGTDPKDDYLDYWGFTKSQSLDLDYDGENEIELAATYSNIKSSLNSIYSKINKDDMLLIFVTDHGGKKNSYESYIYLWNKKKLFDYELEDLLRPFIKKAVSVNIVLGQCNSGGFIDNFREIGCVVSTASKIDETAWKLPYRGYSEFLYHWTSALLIDSPSGMNADKDKNGRVTMQEAFEYAVSHMENGPNEKQTPQFCSTPGPLGEALSFEYLPSCDDLYIKDNCEDTGKEPNITTEICFESPSIWVRNQKDGIEKHENPVFSQSHKKAYIYVKIENRGWIDYNSGQWLHVYCSKASTGLSKAAWKGDEIYNEDGLPTGMHLTPIRVPAIPAGGESIIEVEWNLPEELLAGNESNNTEKHHFCILARVVPDPEDNFDPSGYFDVLADNNIAQKNVSIVSYKDLLQKTKVFVRNINGSIHNYSLELKPRTTMDANIYNLANIELSMPVTLYNSWQAGGCETNEISQPVDPEYWEANEATEAHAVFTFASPESAINSICMDATQLEPVSLKFDFHDTTVMGKTYTLDLIQRDENGKIVGGETFYVESPVFVPSPVDTTIIGIDPIPFPGGITLSAKAPSNSKLTWFDENNKKIGENNKLNLISVNKGDTYKLTALNEKGQLAMAEITLDNVSAIKNVSINATGSLLEIEFVSAVAKDSAIMITNLLDGDVKLSKEVNEGEDKISIDISSLANGTYAVSYLVNNQKIDSRKFNK